MIIELTPTQWIAALVGAVFVGLAKTGFPGVGILSVVLFACVMPARASTGLALPLLIVADVVAVISYHRLAVWKYLIRLAPWAVLGIVVGRFAMERLNDAWAARLIGIILVVLIAVQIWRSRSEAGRRLQEHLPESRVFAGGMGLLAGFTTMVANAAGSIMTLYMLAMKLPKMQFMGTGAWYFFLLNWFKVPFSVNLGLITRESLWLDLYLAPVVIAGALLGRKLIGSINQNTFELIALGFAFLGALRLIQSSF